MRTRCVSSMRCGLPRQRPAGRAPAPAPVRRQQQQRADRGQALCGWPRRCRRRTPAPARTAAVPARPTSIPERRMPTVSAATTAPSRLSSGVPSASDSHQHRQLRIAGRMQQFAPAPAWRSAAAAPWSASALNTRTATSQASGTGASSIAPGGRPRHRRGTGCPATAGPPAARRPRARPGATCASACGSAPSASGNSTTTISANSTGWNASPRRRHSRRRSRRAAGLPAGSERGRAGHPVAPAPACASAPAAPRRRRAW